MHSFASEASKIRMLKLEKYSRLNILGSFASEASYDFKKWNVTEREQSEHPRKYL